MVEILGQLRHKLKAALERYELIQERITEYILAEEVPLQLTWNQRRTEEAIRQLRDELRAAEEQQLRMIAARAEEGARALIARLAGQPQAAQPLRQVAGGLVRNLRDLAASRDDRLQQRLALLGALDRACLRLGAGSFGQLCGLPDSLLREPLAALAAPPAPPRQSADELVQSQSVRSGIHALIDLMHDLRVREIVAAFNADFEQAREGVRVLVFYKDLHDQLHTLQYKCYNPIVRDSRGFSSDGLVLESLGDYEMTMREIIRALADIIERAVPRTPPPDWFADLDTSARNLRAAIEGRDQRLLTLAIVQIDRILNTQPVYINASLIATARTLPLPGLVATLRQLRRHLVGLDLDPAKLGQLEEGTEALSELSRVFGLLLAEHDAWQAIERDMRRLELSLRHDTFELEIFWEDLRAKVDQLCAASGEEWALALRQDRARLEAALAAHEPKLVKEAFLRYRRQTSDRFFRVDTNLKRQCDRLREFGDPFAQLLQLTDVQRAMGA